MINATNPSAVTGEAQTELCGDVKPRSIPKCSAPASWRCGAPIGSTTRQRLRLEALFATHAELARAWAMLQELHGLYLAENIDDAEAALERFADLYEQDTLPEFYKVVDTLIAHAPEIFAFHHAGRVSNGRLEGTNNKLGVLKRTAYGFVNADNFAARGLLLCPGRP